MKPQRLSKAPIEEALIDVRVAPPGCPKEQLEAFGAAIQGRYPHRKDRQRLTTPVEVRPGEAPTAPKVEVAWHGYQFASGDGRQVVQARTDGFTVSRLKPYDTWAALRGEAERLWTEFVGVVRPTGISRLAVRYINQLHLPLPIENSREYMLTYPEVADDMPHAMTNSFMRLVLPDAESQALVILTQAAEATEAPESRLRIVFDIEVLANRTLEATALEVWTVLDQLRQLKNRVFFSSLTDKALEQYL